MPTVTKLGSFKKLTGVSIQGLSNTERCKVFYDALPDLRKQGVLKPTTSLSGMGFRMYFVDNNGTVQMYEYNRAACHASVRNLVDYSLSIYVEARSVKYNVVTPLLIQNNPSDKTEHSLFNGWLVKSDPFKDCFYTNVTIPLNEYGFLVRADIDRLAMFAAITASRIPHEFAWILPIWKRLCQRGIPPMVAGYLARCVNVTGRGVHSIQDSGNPNHDVFSYGIPPKNLCIPYLKLKSVLALTPNGTYTDIPKFPADMKSKLHGGGSGVGTLLSSIQTYTKDNGFSKEEENGFGTKRIKFLADTEDKVVDLLVEYYTKLIGDEDVPNQSRLK